VKRRAKRAKINTEWYDDLCSLYQKTKALELLDVSSSLRNIFWDQVRGLVHGRVHEFVRVKKPSLLMRDRDLTQKLFQESFFIFCKACNIWDKKRKTKFLTFLGDILDQEILNIIRLDWYYKSRDRKLVGKLKEQVIDEPVSFFDEEKQEKANVLEEVKLLVENFNFESEIERDIVRTIIYGKVGDWVRLRKKSGLGIGKFNKVRQGVIKKLKIHIEEKASLKTRAVILEIVSEK
jgi:hypothetical protein